MTFFIILDSLIKVLTVWMAILAAFCFGKLKSPVDRHGIAIDSMLFFSASANTER